jgi:hypothetical protein
MTSPLGRRVRNLLVRHLPADIQRRQLEPLVRHRLP